MRKWALAFLALALLGVKSCGEPYGDAEDTVEDFMRKIKRKEGFEALKFLHPAYRENLTKDLKLPVQFTELKPSEVLACLLSSMGRNIEDVEVKDGKMVGERTVFVKVKVEDKNEIEKMFTFVLVREDDRWYIADITPYIPPKPEEK